MDKNRFLQILEQIYKILPVAKQYQGNLFKHFDSQLNYQFVFEKIEHKGELTWNLISEYKL